MDVAIHQIESVVRRRPWAAEGGRVPQQVVDRRSVRENKFPRKDSNKAHSTKGGGEFCLSCP